MVQLCIMSTIKEIEAAIENLPEPLVEELAVWLEDFRVRRAGPGAIEAWLQRARGAGQPGISTEQVLALTRGEG
jgi:hypothetical protein